MIHFFLHIPKCGGTTIKQYYSKAFNPQNCIKVWNPAYGANCDSKGFSKFDISKANCIIGHLPFLSAYKNETFKHVFDNRNIIIHTVVRDPIDRMLSLYNYISGLEKHPLHNKVKNQNIDDFLLEQPCNDQCRMLGIDYLGSVEGISERIHIIDLEKSNDYFHNYFNDNFNLSIPQMSKKNVTSEQFKLKNLKVKNDISEDIIKLLNKRNELDYQLYEFAKTNTQ